MPLAVLKETAAEERRVALVPDAVGSLVKYGVKIVIESGAGAQAGFADDSYVAAGATILQGGAEVCEQADIVLKVQKPTLDEAKLVKPGGALAAFLQTAESAALFSLLAERRITALAMERVPQIAAAQAMDALSSQATIAGYKAVLMGAAALKRMMPMLITAAGRLVPTKAFIIGAGVAGLQAIATARRLGAVVSALDVRSTARDEVKSLGASFVEISEAPKDAQASGGCARELDKSEQQRVLDAVSGHLPEMDLIITTVQVPERPAPRLITAEMIARMKPGSVIVDLAAETGGNCALTRLGETVETAGVAIYGPVNLAATIPTHASQMYSRNLQSLVQYLLRDGQPVINLADPVTGPMIVTHQGEFVSGQNAWKGGAPASPQIPQPFSLRETTVKRW